MTTLATNTVVRQQQEQQNQLLLQRGLHQSSIISIPTPLSGVIEDFDSKEHVQAQMLLMNNSGH